MSILAAIQVVGLIVLMSLVIAAAIAPKDH